MGLALVQVSAPVFQEIRDHLLSHYPRYRNMHLREARYRNKRVIHYLHALFAPTSALDVEGMISGPDVFWHYRMSMASRTQVHLRVLSHRSSPNADAGSTAFSCRRSWSGSAGKIRGDASSDPDR